MQTPKIWQNTLIIIAVFYLVLLFLVPTIAVFYEAFHNGVNSFLEACKSRDFLEAVKLTLIITLITVITNTIFGLYAAWLIARNQFWGRTLLISIIDLPFSISPVVAGLMIMLLYGRNGWFGSLFETMGIKIVFALPGMVIATIFVTLPFVLREVMPVLEEIGAEEEEAAIILGANDWQVFFRVVLPHIRWGLLYGVLLTNARALGEFGAVSVVSGSIIGQTATLPIFVEQTYKNYQTEVAFSASFVLILIACLMLIVKEILEQKTGRISH